MRQRSGLPRAPQRKFCRDTARFAEPANVRRLSHVRLRIFCAGQESCAGQERHIDSVPPTYDKGVTPPPPQQYISGLNKTGIANLPVELDSDLIMPTLTAEVAP